MTTHLYEPSTSESGPTGEPPTGETGPTEESRPTGVDGGAMSGAVLDIGGETGALVIYADEVLLGGEIEICPTGRLAEREHNIVRERRTPSGSVYAAVFPALIEGYYTVLTEDLEPSYEVSVVGGMVSEIDCSAGGEA